jgi:hypothetical protein
MVDRAGDRLQADYTTPTLIESWLQATSLPESEDPADKQQRYGQWLAQVLHSQLGIPLLQLYFDSGRTEWPMTLRDDFIALLDAYFASKQAAE